MGYLISILTLPTWIVKGGGKNFGEDNFSSFKLLV